MITTEEVRKEFRKWLHDVTAAHPRGDFARKVKRQGVEHWVDMDSVLTAEGLLRGINLNRWDPATRERLRELREELGTLRAQMRDERKKGSR